MTRAKVAIVLLNYNGYDDTEECVNSILDSDYDNLIIVIVDNSTKCNDYLRLIKRYELQKECIFIIRSEQNDGFAVGNNIGIDYALSHNADYVLILNNDTIIKKDCISKLVACIENTDSTCVTGKILNYYDRNIIDYAGGYLDNKKGNGIKLGNGEKDIGKFDKLCSVSYCTGCLILIKKNYLQQRKIPEDFFMYFEDTAFCKILMDENKKIVYEPNAVIFHKGSSSSNKISSFKQFYMIRNQFLYVKRYLTGFDKFFSYMHTVYVVLKLNCLKIYNMETTCRAIKSFLKGEIGKKGFNV